MSGAVDGSTISGAVTVEGARDGSIRLHSISGGIHARDVTGEEVELTSTSGDVAVTQQWNGAAFRARQKMASLKYAYPKEGTEGWMDNVAVLKGAANVENAKAEKEATELRGQGEAAKTQISRIGEARFAALQGGRVDAAAMFRVVKERKFGPGCVDAWRHNAAALTARTLELLAPVARAVAARPFLLGDRPSLADAAVFGQLAMLETAFPGWVAQHAPALSAWQARVMAAKAAPEPAR